jgi:uncharacterized protein YukE
VARNKRPALTSPWKIGFFASLLPIAVGIGVGYFITRAFGITWTWIEFHGTWSDFTFHQDAFMKEMVALVALVPAFSLLSYVLIAGAVRRYTHYVDSGSDYKNLLHSIRKIEDIENENQIRKLSGYSELRDFLLNTRNTIIKRRKALDAREAELEERESSGTAPDNLETETDALVDAIEQGLDGGERRALRLETPELKRIEQAIREKLLSQNATGADNARLSEIRDDLAESARSLSSKLEGIFEEARASEQIARDLEAEVSRLRGQFANPAQAATGDSSGAYQRAIARLDAIAEVLKSLGEETRHVAINTALQASSGNAGADAVVQLADDVRDVAAKFNGIAMQWEEAGSDARQTLGSTSVPNSDTEAEALRALDSLSNKMGLWVERSVVHSEAIKTFNSHYRDALAALETKLGGTPSTARENWSTQDDAPSQPLTDDDTAEFERQGDASGLLTDRDEEAAGGGDFEKQRGVFAEATASKGDEMFADIPSDTAPIEPTDAAPVEEVSEPATDAKPEEDIAVAPMDYTDYGNRSLEPEEEAAPAYHAKEVPIMEDLITGAERPGEAAHVAAEPPQAAADDAIDLYALGAVDYEPENVQHNA